MVKNQAKGREGWRIAKMIDLGKHQPLDISFHPTQPNLIAVSDINGSVRCFSHGTSEDTKHVPVYNQRHHKLACRSIQFSDDGTQLISASSDLSVKFVDFETQKVVKHWKQAHDTAINVICTLDSRLLASADDAGVIKLWDYRQKNCVLKEFRDNEDYISALCYCKDKKTLLAAGGDGYLTVFDIRKQSLLARSDNMETEITSLACVKNGQKVVCGMEDGVCGIFSWDNWGDISDRFPGHPDSIDAMCNIDQNTICTGSMDGIVRVVSILPNKLLGPLGEHEGPVECLRSNCDSTTIASIGHDNVLKFWNLNAEAEVSEQEESDSDESDNNESSKRAHVQQPNPHAKKLKKMEKTFARESFFAGLEKNDESE